MRRDLQNMRYQLMDIAEREATYLFRLAWKMEAHNCNPANIAKCREEARALHMTGCPERLLDSFKTWEYAFKI